MNIIVGKTKMVRNNRNGGLNGKTRTSEINTDLKASLLLTSVLCILISSRPFFTSDPTYYTSTYDDNVQFSWSQRTPLFGWLIFSGLFCRSVRRTMVLIFRMKIQNFRMELRSFLAGKHQMQSVFLIKSNFIIFYFFYRSMNSYLIIT